MRKMICIILVLLLAAGIICLHRSRDWTVQEILAWRPPNVVGGVVGSFPCMVLTTLLGANIRDPSSPAFWKVIALNVAWVLLSALGCWLFKRFTPSMKKEEA